MIVNEENETYSNRISVRTRKRSEGKKNKCNECLKTTEFFLQRFLSIKWQIMKIQPIRHKLMLNSTSTSKQKREIKAETTICSSPFFMEITISLLNLLSQCYNGNNKTINVFLLLLSHTDIVVGMLMMILIITIIVHVDFAKERGIRSTGSKWLNTKEMGIATNHLQQSSLSIWLSSNQCQG